MTIGVETKSVAEWQAAGFLLVEDGNHGEYRPLSGDFVAQGTPFVRPSDLVGGRVVFERCDKISQNAFARIRKGVGRGGDILFTHRATVGRMALVDRESAKFVCNPGVTVWRVLNADVLDRKFLYYWMSSRPFLDQVWSVAGGSDTFPYVSLSEQRKLLVSVPNISTQRAVGACLGALDDKIELNRRMNATLEEMARALFRAWFVDFDPVYARAAGEAPAHMPPETAALFPDSFGDDGLPMGWRMGTLGEVATSPRRGVKPADIDPTTPYIGLEHMPRRSVALDSWEGASKVGSQKSAMRRGEFLFGKLRPYFHKVGIVPVDGICSTDIVVVAPKKLEWAAFVLSVISSDEFVEHTNGSSSGTRMPRTSWKDMAAFRVAMPQRQAALAFEERCRPMRERILANIYESRTLADLRDALLPRLMSGELRVRDAEAMVGGGV